MNVAQNNRDSQSQEYSVSSSGNKNQANFQRLSDSLQYLDRIRSINKKVFDSKPTNQNALISPLQKLVHSERQITYIDNQRLYGIVKIQNFINLKNRVKQLQEQQETYKITEHQLNTKITYLQKQIVTLSEKQASINQIINEMTNALNQQKSLKNTAQQKTIEASDSLMKLNSQKIQESMKYLALLTDYASLNAKAQIYASSPSSHQIICETQTEFYRPTIEIPSFEPNLEQILRKIREKQGEKVSRQTLKKIVAQSLDAFVKELDVQYKLIHEQTIDLNKLRELNQSLVEENNHLRLKNQQLDVEEEKLKIFRNCMTSFLDDASQNVSKSIEAERIRKRIYENLTQDQRNLLAQTLPEVEIINEEGNESPEMRQLKIMKENMEYLKKENIELLKTIGDYQYKMKKVEKVLDEKRREEIPDDGTVGQLVKMSKMVKESIKSLLQEL